MCSLARTIAPLHPCTRAPRNELVLSRLTGIAHRDLKPENILVQRRPGATSETDVILKLTDFGLARACSAESMMHTMCGTPLYLAPEVLQQRKHDVGYTKCVDIWSTGIMLYIMLSGVVPDNANIKGADLKHKNFRYVRPKGWLCVFVLVQCA